MYVTSTCSKCSAQWSWDTDHGPAPLCPDCGYDSIYGGRRNIERKPREGSQIHKLPPGTPWPTELASAVIQGDVPLVSKLAARGDDVLDGNPDTGETPLHVVCLSDIIDVDVKREQIAKILIEHGADLLGRTIWNEIPQDLAKFEKRGKRLIAMLDPSKVKATGAGQTTAAQDGMDRARAFVAARRKRGETDEAIGAVLKSTGWTQAQVQALFSAVGERADARAQRKPESSEGPAHVSLPEQYVSAPYNIAVKYPPGWEVVFEDRHEAPWWQVVGIGGPQGPSGRAGLIVCVSSLMEATPVDLDAYMRKAQSDLDRIFSDLRVLSATQTRLRGRPTAWMQYTYNSDQGTIQELNVTMVFGRDHKLLVQFICEAPAAQASELLPTFKAMMVSFRMLDDRLRIPSLLFAGVKRCGMCGREIPSGTQPTAVLDAKEDRFLALCPRCDRPGEQLLRALRAGGYTPEQLKKFMLERGCDEEDVEFGFLELALDGDDEIDRFLDSDSQASPREDDTAGWELEDTSAAPGAGSSDDMDQQASSAAHPCPVCGRPVTGNVSYSVIADGRALEGVCERCFYRAMGAG